MEDLDGAVGEGEDNEAITAPRYKEISRMEYDAFGGSGPKSRLTKFKRVKRPKIESSVAGFLRDIALDYGIHIPAKRKRSVKSNDDDDDAKDDGEDDDEVYDATNAKGNKLLHNDLKM